jgi:hypothetical protein
VTFGSLARQVRWGKFPMITPISAFEHQACRGIARRVPRPIPLQQRGVPQYQPLRSDLSRTKRNETHGDSCHPGEQQRAAKHDHGLPDGEQRHAQQGILQPDDKDVVQ